MSEAVFTPRGGYDLVAPIWEAWRWSQFWRFNEAPLIAEWLDEMSPGLGLDAGSGTGQHAFDLSRQPHRRIAVDLSLGMLLVQKSKYYGYGLRGLVQADIGFLPFRKGHFQWVLCTRVLSHLPDLSFAFRGFTETLSEGGECLLSDIHPEHPYTHTSVETGLGKVHIETHKHSFSQLSAAVGAVDNLEVLYYKEFRLKDLCWKPSEGFDKLYDSPERPIFYMMRLKKIRS